MSKKLDTCFHYDPPAGRIALRQQITTYLQRLKIKADADNIIVTSGAQQAIDLSVRALVSPGSTVIVEQPAYYGAINALLGARARILEVPMEQDGMNLGSLEDHLRQNKVRLIYTNSTFQNPTGITMSEQKRRDLLALSRRHGAVILEDDHSSELRFTGNVIPPIRALADTDDLVLYARSFGKVFLPGVRLGYLVVPYSLRGVMLTAKAHADLHSNSFIQEGVAEYLARSTYPKFLDRIRDKYGRRQEQLCRDLAKGMPAGTVVNQPEGGLSLWLTLPEGADVSELYFRAVRRGVAFVSGDVFYIAQSGSRSLRMSFGLNPSDELQEGVYRLCSVVKDLLTGRSTRNLVMM
jgi:DNA-binding transcriptional MocR family regulator